MQKGLMLLLISITLMAAALINEPLRQNAGLPALIAAKKNFLRDALAFDSSTRRLQLAVIRTVSCGEKQQAVAALQECRLQYKKIESFLSWFFPDVALGLNGPPVCEGEEPYMEYRAPTGLQVMETLLTDKTQPPDEKRLLQQTSLLAETARSIPSLLYHFDVCGSGIMQSIRLASIRMSVLGITGYDAPSLKTGIRESAVVCDAIRETLSSFPGTGTLVRLASDMATQLKTDGNFDGFDRAAFLTKKVGPFQRELKLYCEINRIPLPGEGLLRSGATEIFSADALQPADFFPPGDALAELGRKWFNDKTLSRGAVKSCASCHNPASAFADNIPVSAGLNPLKPLKRNTPGLLYCSYQYRQFWDGKAAGLESQIHIVLHDSLEMNIDTVAVQKRWDRDSKYREMIAAAFPGEIRPSPSQMIGLAIGAYVSTLGKFNSDFDRFMQGDSAAISVSAKNGFNLFMGKARCGSCHFAPVFNGTLPPAFDRTEFEILGTTMNGDFRHPRLSSDKGRYSVYPLPFNRYSFKTPTVRNAAQTAPYMHNGRFSTLDQVLTFYNNGGGAGMGLKVPGQTLAPDSLHLRKDEMKDLIAFISALTDKPEPVKQ